MIVYYTGIGSRSTPRPVLDTMVAIAHYLGDRGYTLRSGGAAGADTAFQYGAFIRPFEEYRLFGRWTINYHPQPRISRELRDQAEAIAKRLTPYWDRIPENKRPYLARNPFQVTGATLDSPSAFVLYWAPERNGEPQGGTRTAVMYARELDIPTFNLGEGTERFKGWLRTYEPEGNVSPHRATSTEQRGPCDDGDTA